MRYTVRFTGVIILKSFFLFLVRTFTAGVAALLIWMFSLFQFDQSFLASTLFALIGGGAIYYGVKIGTQWQFLRKNGLTRREYKIIEQNLKEAKDKIHRLQKSFIQIRNLTNAKQNFETLRVIYKIYNITKKEPKRFFLVEQFYFSHLESMVELAEKYTFLSSQPAKNAELTRSLIETKDTMDDLVKLIEQDLHTLIAGDIHNLNFEIDVAKKFIDRK